MQHIYSCSKFTKTLYADDSALTIRDGGAGYILMAPASAPEQGF